VREKQLLMEFETIWNKEKKVKEECREHIMRFFAVYRRIFTWHFLVITLRRN
jgi:hypothetical protein